jgi:hypothetical protein
MKLFARNVIVAMSYLLMSLILFFLRDFMSDSSLLAGFIYGIIVSIVSQIIIFFIKKYPSA